MTSATTPPDKAPKTVKKLVLCFDGTGNKFSGSSGDTNIVKLYHKFDKDNDDNQYHYYQTGIGTYDISSGSINKGFFGSIKSSVSRSLDSGFGTTFDAHVIAGYRFIMRYYDTGDKIYLFGFSRGAFTARFLARMINTVGLLSKGNEEMVPFAYELYQSFEQGVASVHTNYDADEVQKKKNEIHAFQTHFCRKGTKETSKRQGVKVWFLGIFDCVSSVAVLDNPTAQPVKVTGTAHHVRHAVAVDERRVKFKPALLHQDKKVSAKSDTEDIKEDIKEVWFPGNHGDVGGGWPPPSPDERQNKVPWKDFFRKLFLGAKQPNPPESTKEDPYQMSDIPLSWMINELERVDKGEAQNSISWNEERNVFEKNFQEKGIVLKESLQVPQHDTLKFCGGSNFTKVLLWNLMECLPFLPRWELELPIYKWYNPHTWGWRKLEPKERETRTWTKNWLTPNYWQPRDIPEGAFLHDSLIKRLGDDPNYKPQNNHGDRSEKCLFKPGDKSSDKKWAEHEKATDKYGNHTIWTFPTKSGTAQALRNGSTDRLI